jgi:hypothetical protein
MEEEEVGMCFFNLQHFGGKRGMLELWDRD